MLRRSLALACLVTSVARSASAQSPPPSPARVPLALHWTAPSACPDRAHVLAQVTRLLGRTPETPPSRPLVIDAVVSLDSTARWRVEIQTASPEGFGRRALSADTCQRLADAASLVVALLIDPRAGIAAPPSPPPPARPVRTPPAARSSLRGAARALVLGDLGMLPTVTAGAGLALALDLHWFRAEISASTWLPRTVDFDAAGARVRVSAPLAGGARGCALARWGRLEAGGCAGAELAWLRGTGQGNVAPATADVPWIALAVGGTASLALSPRWALRAQLEGGVPVRAASFVLNGCGTLCQIAPWPVFARLGVGLEARF